MKLKSCEEIKAYYQGKKAGIWLYAWWKEGAQHVGTCGTLYSDAVAELKYQEDEALQAFAEGKDVFTG